MDELVKFVGRVKKFLTEDQTIFASETSVREQIVLPVLGYLDWDTANPLCLRPEFPLKNRKVDYALFTNSSHPSCIIEVKAIGKVDADSQLFEYAFHAGAPLAVLTDGREWRVYLPMSRGNYNERLVRTINLEKSPEVDTAKALKRYLSFKNTHNGDAERYAKSDRDLKFQREQAKSNIPKAWNNLLKVESDNRLVQFIVDETSKISDYAPDISDVKVFLENLNSHPENFKNIETNKISGISQRTTKFKPKQVTYWLFNQQCISKNYTEAYLEIMEKIVEQIPAEKFDTLRFINQDKNEIPSHGQRSKRRLTNGMWVHTHKDTRTKLRELKNLCEAANAQFGKPSGLKIS